MAEAKLGPGKQGPSLHVVEPGHREPQGSITTANHKTTSCSKTHTTCRTGTSQRQEPSWHDTLQFPFPPDGHNERVILGETSIDLQRCGLLVNRYF